MPRLARLDAPGTLHHVMVRGIGGLKIFRNKYGREDFISHLSELVKSTQARIVAWVLMDNHAHLLMFSGHEGISKFMRCLLTGYAIRYNQRYRRRGHLFQNRYKSIVCEEEAYLMELVRYIHLNPLRAGVVKSVRELGHYPWSGHVVLIGRYKNNWQERDYVLGQFGKGKGKAIRAYLEFMEQGKGQGRREDLVGGGLIRSAGGWSRVLSLRARKEEMENDARILGNGDFVTEILREADKKLKRQLRLKEKSGLVEQVIKRLCDEERVSEEELRNGGQRRKVSEVRARISYHLTHEMGIPLAEIARHLGVCASAVAKAVQKHEDAIEK